MKFKLNKENADKLGLKEGQEIEVLEEFTKIYMFDNIPVYDLRHAQERFEERFPNLDWAVFLNKLDKGLRKIKIKYSLRNDNYAIISRKYDLKIPVEIRDDRFNPKKQIIGIPTVLDVTKHGRDLQNEIDIMVEKCKKDNRYSSVKLFEDSYSNIFFQYIIEEGEVNRTFEEIVLD